MDPNKIIRETAAGLQPMNLSVQTYHGMVTLNGMLTPPHVRETKGPHFWEARATLKFDPRQGARELYGWDRQVHLGERFHVAIFQAGLSFPFVCPVNLEAPTHSEVVELRVFQGTQGKIQFNMPREQVIRAHTALTCNRYWFVIPFSAGRSLDDRAVHFVGEQKNLPSTVQFKNHEYSRRFKALNHLEGGKWQTVMHKIIEEIGLVVFLASLVCLIVGVRFWLSNNRSGEWGHWTPTSLAICNLIFLMVMGLSFFLWVKGLRGEPL